jgi:DNA primase
MVPAAPAQGEAPVSQDLTIEDLCIHEGLDHRLVFGARGEQVQIRECPSCHKDDWKVYANADSGAGNCFSCGITFNIWSFVGYLLEGRSGSKPEKRMIGQYLDKIRRVMGYRPKAKASIKPAVKVEEGFELPFSQALPYEDGWNHPYLQARGIDGHYAALFHLRYSSFGKHIYLNDQGEKQTQSFAERILIPVYDLDGKLVTFQGRDTTNGPDRYKFAGGLPGTARYLYNGHVALARRSKRAVMGEGAFDVIGIQKALDSSPDLSDAVPVGSWGKHLSKAKEGPDQVTAFATLKRAGLEEVTILYDGEPAAYTEALKAAELITKVGLRAKVGLMPLKMDPGEADASTILKALREAQEFTRVSSLRMRMRNPYAPS